MKMSSGDIVGRLVDYVADRDGVLPHIILSACKRADLARIRWAIIYVAREKGLSLPQLTAAIGRADHTTALHGLRQADRLVGEDSDFAELVRELRHDVSFIQLANRETLAA